jgi:hypothetical protein
MTTATDPTSVTTEPDESEPLDSPVTPMSNDTFSTIQSQMNVHSTATSKTPAEHTFIATMLFVQLMFSLLV